MARFDTDPWIHKPRGARFPSPAQFHALGVVAYNWNICEEAIRALFSDATALPLRVRYTITHDMGDVAMVEKLRAVPAKRRLGPAATAAIIHACDLYDICRQNRNALIHAKWIRKRRGGYFASLHKKTGAFPMVAEDVEIIRRVVKEIGDCCRFICDVTIYLLHDSGYRPPLP